MKNIFKLLSVCSLTAAVGIASSATVLAAGINDAEQSILDELHTTVTMQGREKSLPSSYINQTENYLNTVELTDAEAQQIIAGIEETKAYLTSTGAANYDGLTDAQIDTFFSYCQKTVSVINLKIAYNKATRVVTIIDENGKVVFTATIGNGGKVDPDPIKPTGFDFSIPGVMTVAGIGVLLVSAAGVYLVSTKKKKEAAENA